MELGEGRFKREKKLTQSIVSSSNVCFLFKLVNCKAGRKEGGSSKKDTQKKLEKFNEEKRQSNERKASRAIVIIF